MTNKYLAYLASAAVLFAGPAPAFAQDEAAVPEATAAATEAGAAEAPEDLIPRGAPSDDYEFVGWCVGALATHMQLYSQVKPQLDEISERWDTVEEDAELYAAMEVGGRETLAKFEQAMRAAEAASPRNIAAAGRVAVQSGVAMWKDISTVEPVYQAYSWMGWELPARCERVATDLENRSVLMGALLRGSSDPTAPAP